MNEATPTSTWSRRAMVLGGLASFAVLLSACHAHRHYGGHHGHHGHYGRHGWRDHGGHRHRHYRNRDDRRHDD